MARALTNSGKSAADRVAKRHEKRRMNAVAGHRRNPESNAPPHGASVHADRRCDVGALVFNAPCYVACNISDRSKRLGSCEREHPHSMRRERDHYGWHLSPSAWGRFLDNVET
jgi:hypothetical protein